ncbi:MAG: hypothetical protein WCY88_14815 [Spongiibacteraceae bacterium]
MKHLIFATLLAMFAITVQAADVVGQRYIDQMTRGGNVSIKQAAQSIYNGGERDTEVLDVAAEILLQKYPKAVDRDIDTLSWLAKALGSSQNNRYYNTLKEVADSNVHRKLRKYARQALDQVEGSSAAQYTKGSVDLAALRKGGAKSKAVSKKSTQANSSSSTAKATIDDIRVGMSMEEVYALIGQPTGTSTYQTGKAWVPFNFGAKDVARSVAAYKGQGRIIFSHSGFAASSRVLEVVIDPEETGYP